MPLALPNNFLKHQSDKGLLLIGEQLVIIQFNDNIIIL